MRIWPLALVVYVSCVTLIPFGLLARSLRAQLGAVVSDRIVGEAFLASVLCGLVFAVGIAGPAYMLAAAIEITASFRRRTVIVFLGLITFALADAPLSLMVSDISRVFSSLIPWVEWRPLSLLPTVLKLLIQTLTAFSLILLLAIGGSGPLAVAAVNCGARPRRLWLGFLGRRATGAMLLLLALAFVYGFSAPNSNAQVGGFLPLHELINNRVRYMAIYGADNPRALSALFMLVTVLFFMFSLWARIGTMRPISLVAGHHFWPPGSRILVLRLASFAPCLCLASVFGYVALGFFGALGVKVFPSQVIAAFLDRSPMLARSLAVAVIAASGSAILAIPAAYSCSQLSNRLCRVTCLVAMVPLAIPSATYAVAAMQVVVVLREHLLPQIPGLFWLIPFLILRALPFVFLISLAAFQTAGTAKIEAALNLGTHRWSTFWRVSWPECWPFLVAAVFLALATNLNDYSVSFYLGGSKPLLGVWIQQGLSFRNDPLPWLVSLALLSGEAIVLLGLAWAGTQTAQRHGEAAARALAKPTPLAAP